MAKLWKGRFAKATHPLMEAFSESVSFDQELAEVDLEASRVHAAMLARTGLLTKKEAAALRRGLREIRDEIRDESFEFRPEDEDIHTAVETALTRRIGEAAKKLHTARSRNDQVATDLRLWTRGKIDWMDRLVHELQRALLEVAEREKQLVVPGYTHLQRAQPVLLAHHLLAYVEMLQRDRDRLADARSRVNRLPLGAGALAGTTLPIDRAFVCEELGFAGVCDNSLDAVSDRDFVIEVLAALSLLFVHLSRFAEDVILWASAEWGLVVLDEAWSTGSSIMPQKRNPDLLELTRGKTGRVVGGLVSVLTLMKGLPLAYNRDLQEDKEPLFDAMVTAEKTLACLTEFVPTLQFQADRAAALLGGGHLEATAMAEYLVEQGVPFREAHGICGELVRTADRKGCALGMLPLAILRKSCSAFGEDVYARLDPARVVEAYRSQGSAGTKALTKALRRWKRRLKD